MIEVIFEDNHILVLNKPAGLLTQPSGTDQDSLETQAKAWLKDKYQKPGNVFLEATHRLDKPVSGLVLFAKTSKALSRLNAATRDKRSQKIYRALVENCPSSDSGKLEHYLTHGEHKAEVSSKSDPQAKLCRLHYQVLEKFTGTTLLEIVLETGRYHQIRAQLSAIGCPIVGDRKYGARTALKNGFDAIALHHAKLEIIHPVGGTTLNFEAATPSWTLS